MSSISKVTLKPANEDTVQCLYFSTSLGSDVSLWEDLCHQINNTIKILSKDYIWHKDEFQLYLPSTDFKDAGVPTHLCSDTCFGDNLEDEWYIVHLILEISKQFENVIIQITDNDGDFLLIEAADFLPCWVNPESTENRVFIFNGHIHIIPPELIALDSKLELNTALKIVDESPNPTRVSCDIEQAILKRIGNYPEKLHENNHKAIVELPASLAALLILRPTLIAPIVDAYCNHDIIDARLCKNIDFSDCVKTGVNFTKFLYATLIHSKLINSVKHLVLNNQKERILGLKLMCGYQMIMSKHTTDLLSSKDYHKYMTSLKENGYFKNNIEGSVEYNNLLEKAKQYFSIIECPLNLSLSHNISNLMTSQDYIKIKDSIKEKHQVETEPADSEDWLNINPEQLNELLMSRYGKTSKFKNNDVISSHAVTTELSSFLKQTSDFEGIEQHHNELSEDDNTIEFESDKFVACIEKMLSMLTTEATENDESDYSDDNNDYMDNNDDDDNDSYDEELKTKLQKDQSENLEDSEVILANIIQSMKEEKSSTGPTSNLLRFVGVHKPDLLDSDDNDDVD